MWSYQDCVEEFAKRRKGAPTKKICNNVYMRHEGDTERSTFIFKLHHTDIVKVNMDLTTNRQTYILAGGGWGSSQTTTKRINDFTGLWVYGHERRPLWCPENCLRVGIASRVFDLAGDQVLVRGYPFTDGMSIYKGVPEGDFSTEEFKIIDPAIELERKRQVRPWLEGIKVAVGLTYGLKLKEWSTYKDTASLLERITRGDPFDMAPVLDRVHYEWSRRDASPQKQGHDMGKEVYKAVTEWIFLNTRNRVPWIKVTGHLLDGHH